MKSIMAIPMKVWVIVLALIMLAGAAFPQVGVDLDSIRDSDYAWKCETTDGTFISGHTRPDKALVRCLKESSQNNGDWYIVRSGTYRVRLKFDESPPEDEIPPADEPPALPEQPLVSFGPVTDTFIEFPNSIAATRRDEFRWEITFTLSSMPSGSYGLASKDATGRPEPGHLSVWVHSSGELRARLQDIDGGSESILLASTTLIEANRKYVAIVSVGNNGFGLFLDGVLEASNTWSTGTTMNTNPLILGGMCMRCDRSVEPQVGPNRIINGTVEMSIFASPMEFNAPVASSLNLSWDAPTEYVDGKKIEVGDLTAFSVYRVSPGDRRLITSVEGDVQGYEVIGLTAGTGYCHVVTASAGSESDDSNVACKVP